MPFECLAYRFGFVYGRFFTEASLNLDYTDRAKEGDPNCNHMRDRFYFTFPFFSAFLLLRLFIIKEPYLFLILHFMFSIFYLKDQYLFYTYIYAFIITNQ